jgi:hypothetical protein
MEAFCYKLGHMSVLGSIDFGLISVYSSGTIRGVVRRLVLSKVVLTNHAVSVSAIDAIYKILM